MGKPGMVVRRGRRVGRQEFPSLSFLSEVALRYIVSCFLMSVSLVPYQPHSVVQSTDLIMNDY